MTDSLWTQITESTEHESSSYGCLMNSWRGGYYYSYLSPYECWRSNFRLPFACQVFFWHHNCASNGRLIKIGIKSQVSQETKCPRGNFVFGKKSTPTIPNCPESRIRSDAQFCFLFLNACCYIKLRAATVPSSIGI